MTIQAPVPAAGQCPVRGSGNDNLDEDNCFGSDLGASLQE